MDSLLWQVSSRSAETLLIFSLFHFLLAGLTLLMVLRQRLCAELDPDRRPELLLPVGFGLLVLHFALLTLYFGASFFFQRLQLHQPDRLLHGLLIAAVVVIVSAYHERATQRVPAWLWPALAGVTASVTVDLLFAGHQIAGQSHSPIMLVSDAIAAGAVVSALCWIRRLSWEARGMRTTALAALALALLAHGLPQFLPNHAAVIVWNLDEHLLSIALLGFAWAAGERSHALLDRVFVRLNLTFIVLASLIMLSTAAMEKYQYFRITDERSSNLAEFLRGHVVYYKQHGEDLAQIFNHPEVVRRVVVEFGNIPELRQVDVSLRGERASFWWKPDGEIDDYIGAASQARVPRSSQNSFLMTKLPIDRSGQVEFTGTMDFVDQRIGKYIIFIYSSFTLVLLLATGVIGIIVADTDRQLKRQYADLQEAQQQLAQSAKLASIGELAGGMAHEINNPITSILSLASFLNSGRSAERFTARERKNLQLITEQAERITRLVKGLLTFSRQTQLQLAPLDTEELLGIALGLVQHRLSSEHVRVLCEFQPGLPLIRGDRGRLTEVLVNLLANAVDAMPTGGVLRIRAMPDPDNSNCVRIEVQDNGVGIVQQELSRIFDPFFTTKPPGSGTGLGLSISHGIVKDHGGQIWANSAPGTGTTIFISLPQELLHEATLAGD